MTAAYDAICPTLTRVGKHTVITSPPELAGRYVVTAAPGLPMCCKQTTDGFCPQIDGHFGGCWNASGELLGAFTGAQIVVHESIPWPPSSKHLTRTNLDWFA